MRIPLTNWRSHQCAVGGAILALAVMAILCTRVLGRWLLILPACLFYELSGLPCPTCGATRATLAFARGDWLTALHLNPLVVLIYLAIIAGGALMMLFAAFNKRVDHRHPGALLTKARWWLAGSAAANWLYLLLHDIFK
jgi:hypothetical protein